MKKAVIGAVAAITAIAPTPLLAASGRRRTRLPEHRGDHAAGAYQAAVGPRGPAVAGTPRPSGPAHP